MKKIVILGCENSHADIFLGFIKNDAAFSDVEVSGVYSDDKTAAEKLAEKYGVKVMSAYDEAVGKVDGVIVTARHGNNHYKYAAPYIKTGVPMFIDKPITINEGEALKLARECKAAGVRLTGGSTCVHDERVQTLKNEHDDNKDGKTISGFIRCPINLKNNYGDFFFYSEHLVGIMSTIFGYYPESVKAYKNAEKITVVFRYKDYDVTGLYVDKNNLYYAMRIAENGVHGEELPINELNPCFKMEFNSFYGLLCGEKQRLSYEDFIAPVFVLNAIQRSLESGNEEKINKFEV